MKQNLIEIFTYFLQYYLIFIVYFVTACWYFHIFPLAEDLDFAFEIVFREESGNPVVGKHGAISVAHDRHARGFREIAKSGKSPARRL